MYVYRFYFGKEKKILVVIYNNNLRLIIKEYEGGEGVMVFNYLENVEYGLVWEMGNVCIYFVFIFKLIWFVLMVFKIYI